MPNYQDSKIYKIVNVNDPNDDYVYIGSTTQTLSRRMTDHRTTSTKNPNRKLYQHIIGNGGWINFKIILIENFPCENKEQLLARENFWQKQMNSITNGLNMVNAVFDVEANKAYKLQYRIDNKDKMKQYAEANKDKLDQYRRQYYEANKAKINLRVKQYTEANKDKYKQYLKQYRDNNKEKLKQQKQQHYELNKDKYKQYRESNKDKINQFDKQYREKNKNKNTCCVCSYQTSNSSKLQRHQNSQRHQANQAIYDFIHY